MPHTFNPLLLYIRHFLLKCGKMPHTIWDLLEPHIPGQAGCWGGIARDNRLFVNAVLWIMRTRRGVA